MENVTDTQNEVVEQQNNVADQAAAEEATAREAKEQEREGEQAEKQEKPEVGQAKHNRENADFRTKTSKRLRELELENARLKGVEEGLKAGGKTETTKTDTANDLEALYAKQNPEPQPEQFETNGEYLKAIGKWNRGFLAFEQEETAKQEQAKQSRAELAQKVESQRTRGEEKYEDFEEVVRPVEFEPATLRAITESDRGEDIAYFLATNPQEKARIDKLSPFLQAKEIGRIEAGIESGKIQTKKTSSAPPPPATLRGKSSPTVDESKMSDEEYYRREDAKKLERLKAGRR